MAHFLRYKAGNNKELLTKNIGDPIAKAANGHEYVDLGLPSGTLWAKCNVGAETETDYGLYFAWGETQGYTADQVGTRKNFLWSDYKYGAHDATDTTNYGMTKYNATDELTTLELSDDAAHVNMGGIWRIPTMAEISELLSNTNCLYVSNYKGTKISGMTFTTKSDSSKVLFIPFAGYGVGSSIVSTDSSNSLWSSTLNNKISDSAFNLYVNSKGDGDLRSNDLRCRGYSVRGVLKIN